jgi:lipoyl(octanoyl) transferase
MKKIIWKTEDGLVPYESSLEYMEDMVNKVIIEKEQGLVWVLEHDHVYTGGSSAQDTSLLDSKRFPIYKVGRGGDYTYHGPGQIVVYLILNLKKIFAPQEPDLKKYVYYLEEVIIQTLAEFDIIATRKKSMIGVWVNIDSKDKKIAAIGVRVKKWVSYHGLAINFNPDLANFSGIIPCGIREYGVTSVKKCNHFIDKDKFIFSLKNNIKKILKVHC